MNEQQYLSDRVSFGSRIGWGQAWLLRRQLEKYAEDSQVTVYYDPNDPSQAVLEQHSTAVWRLAALAAGMFWLAGWIVGLV